MKKIHTLLIIILGLFLLLPSMVHAQRRLIYEDMVTLSPYKNRFEINYKNPSSSGSDFTVRGMTGLYPLGEPFPSFRVDFNADTTYYLTYKDLQRKKVFVLRFKGLLCKIKIVDYTSFIKTSDILFGPDYWFSEVKLNISVWGSY